jgi:hypothetical protein
MQKMDCFICLEKIKSYKKSTLYCGCINNYHKKCLKQWITERLTCPICHINLFYKYIELKRLTNKEECDTSLIWIDLIFEKLIKQNKIIYTDMTQAIIQGYERERIQTGELERLERLEREEIEERQERIMDDLMVEILPFNMQIQLTVYTSFLLSLFFYYKYFYYYNFVMIYGVLFTFLFYTFITTV